MAKLKVKLNPKGVLKDVAKRNQMLEDVANGTDSATKPKPPKKKVKKDKYGTYK